MMPVISNHQMSIAYKRMFTIFEHAWYCHQPVFIQFEQTLRLYQRALALGLYYKLLKPHTPLIPFHAHIDDESATKEISECEYLNELDCIIEFASNE